MKLVISVGLLLLTILIITFLAFFIHEETVRLQITRWIIVGAIICIVLVDQL